MNLDDPRSKPVPPNWIPPITEWALHLAAAGQSPATITTRTDHLRRASRHLNPNPWHVTPHELEQWVGAQTWSHEARRSVYNSLRAFYRWACATHRTTLNPTTELPRVHASHPHPRPAPDPIIQRAQRGADDRLRLILRLAAEAGLRRAEIAQIHRDDLVEDLDGWSLLVHGKGGKERLVPLTPQLSEAVISACLAGGGWALPGDDAGHLSPRWVGKLATRALPGDWTLHTLRHRFATRVHDETRDLLVVQELLGHASVATTQRYVATPKDRLRAAVLTAAA